MTKEKQEKPPEKQKNYFEVLNAVNVADKVEKKNNLSYLSWAFAWGELKKLHPDAQYKIYETESGVIYHTDGKTCWVKVGVNVMGQEHIEYLPVMDYKNASIHLDKVTSFDVNKAIQRGLTKAIARHGLGLYIYAGEDLPEDEKKPEIKNAKTPEDVKAGQALGGSVRAVDPEQQKQFYDQALKDIAGAGDLEKLKAVWAKINSGLKTFTEEQVADLLAAKEQAKIDIENKPPF